MRGEKIGGTHSATAITGSSPHAWGKVLEHLMGVLLDRIIPTCVGKRAQRGGGHVHDPDHPHMRGEKAESQRNYLGASGSSPHAWGKETRTADPKLWRRIIPTCVGKSGGNPDISPKRADHPHMRGEKCAWSGCRNSWSGSSPHAWGKVKCPYGTVGDRRIIPTCVGKSVCDAAVLSP